MAEIIRIEPQIPSTARLRKVAAYARVSMESERLLHSLQAQTSYYEDLIRNHPGWEFAEIYADEGISGTRTRKRAAFQQMIADAEAGKIDLILTKSISRFARNTVDLLQTVRDLKEIGVEVRFEEQNLSTFTEAGELMLSILASFAEEEVRSISKNVKWSIHKAFSEGRPQSRFPILGYRWEGGDLVPVPIEAEIVRDIFRLYLSGRSMREITEITQARGYRTATGLPFNRKRIYELLTRETYTGKLLLQQTYISDPISKRRKVNHGELTRYRIENHHPAIISQETFDAATKLRKKRAGSFFFLHNNHKPSVFTRKIRCACCGSYYWRTTNRNPIGKTGYVYWMCSSKRKKQPCPSKGLPDDRLRQTLAHVMGLPDFDESYFREYVDHIEMGVSLLTVFYKDGSLFRTDWDFNGKELHHRLRRRAKDDPSLLTMDAKG
jgi:site-specific DNA recombinase